MYKTVFVCTGNICRSSTAEAVLRHFIDQDKASASLACASRGLIGYHVGEAPDIRACVAAQKRGYAMENLRAVQFKTQDFDDYDLIIAMDEGHFATLMERASHQIHQDKIRMFGDFLSDHIGADIPDPYYGGDRGFELVLNMVEDGARGMLSYLKTVY